MSAFVIDLATLHPGAQTVVLACGAEELGLPPAEWHGRVGAELIVERSGEQVSVRGSVRANADLECVRCLRAFESAVEAPLVVFAERAGQGRHTDDESELERDRFMAFHDGRHLDVSEEAREVLILELPIAPRCREDCRGLCPKCGADLNEGPCGCGE